MQTRSIADDQSATVILPAEPSQVEQFAATELQRCLHASLGWNVNVSNGNVTRENGSIFFIGSLDSGITKARGCPAIDQVKVSALRDDGVYLKGDGKNVVLLGIGRRGSLNAVYTYLEKYVGCRWPEPGREFIPKLSVLKLDVDHAHDPAFVYRGVALHGPCTPAFYHQIIDWLGKNRLNTLQFSCEVYDQQRPELLNDVLDRGLLPKIGAHSRQYFYSSEEYFQLHPEQFALVKGKRIGSTQICYSNHDSVPEYAKNVVQYLKARPEIAIVGLWPSDGFGFCECDQCTSGSTTDILLDYVNSVSQAVHDHNPEVKVEFLSYIHYTVPPQNVKPLQYVVPTYCEYQSRNQFHPITDERSSNFKCREQLEQWVRVSNQATVYSYYADDVIKKFLYNPVPDVVLADLQYYRRIGVAGNSVLMMNPQNWWANAPHMYAYARASWDLTDTLPRINDDYFTSVYGPAATAMQAHQHAARALFDTTFGHGQTGEDILFKFQIDNFNPANEASSRQQFADSVREMRDHLAEAVSATNDPTVMARIEILDQDAQLMELIYGVINEAACFEIDKDASRQTRVRTLMERVGANEVAGKEDIRRNIIKSLLKPLTTVLGPEEAAQYNPHVVLPIE
jgi:hypothetical protein